ncbi:hypothetical protein BJX64DRAFT_271955 [Aspergillus heterothallicus]
MHQLQRIDGQYIHEDEEANPGLRAGAGPQLRAVLVEFETTQVFTHLRKGDLDPIKLVLRGTTDDPMDTVPVQELTSATYSGYEALKRVVQKVGLDKDFDFRPLWKTLG